MVQTINLHDFRKAFQEIRPNNFSYEGLERLYEYLTYDEESHGQIELDVIGLCCDFCEMTPTEIQDNYSHIIGEMSENQNKYSYIMDFLENHTMVCGDTAQGTIVFGQF